MSQFSVSQMAMTGFRVVRENPAAVAIWAVLQVAGTFLATAALIAGSGGAVAELQAMAHDGSASADPTAMIAALRRLAPVPLALMPAGLLFNSVMAAAMNRVILRPQDKAFAYLRIGGDELRQFLLGLMATLAAGGAYVAVVVAVIVATIVATLAAKVAALLGVLVGVLSALGIATVSIVVAVRLSLAPARTFATGRVDLFGSWEITRGHFWPILGTHVLAVFLAMVVLAICSMVSFSVTAISTGLTPASDAMLNADYATLARFFTPALVIYLGINSASTALLLPVISTPAAAIYAALTAAPPPARPVEGGTYVPVP
jgi:hypothetical protein